MSPSRISSLRALETHVAFISLVVLANPARSAPALELGGGPAPTPAWTAEINQAQAAFGVSVAPAGDVNGDHISDVLVGAPAFDRGQIDEGGAWLFLGSSAGLAANAVWAAESNQDSAAFGFCVAPAGDVNGDGHDDVLIGAPFFSNGEGNEGRAYLYLGLPSGLTIAPAWSTESNQLGASFATSVATAGDVNGDGYADVIVGAPNHDNGQGDEGRAYLFLESASGLAATPAWTAESNQAGAHFGISVAPAGDVNADGFADVIVGADLYDNGQTDEGRAYLYLGSPSGLAVAPAWTAESNQQSAFFGYSVATAGDTNADGYADVIVGANRFDNGEPSEGRAFVYFGIPTGLAPNPIWTAESNQNGARYGWSVAPAGDVNGDGFADVVIGAERYDTRGTDAGKVWVHLGSRSGPEAAPVWSTDTDQAFAQFGFAVATAGDVDDDGFSDVLIGAPGFDNGEVDEGQAFVYAGSGAPPSSQLAWSAQSNQDNAFFGTSAGTAGDVNGDGYNDVVIGAPSYTNGQLDEGRAYLYVGGANGLSGAASWITESNQAGSGYGFSAGTAGDVNGDGYSDVIVGASTYDITTVDDGRLYVYHGSAAGLGTAAAWIENGDQPDAELGHSVGTAGDVNGDGYSDVIASAYFYSNGQLQEGRTYVYLGSATGLPPTPVWTKESNQAGALFGSSVGTAGDVNGDGYADVIIGAYGFNNALTYEGAAFVFHGGPSGPTPLPAWMAEGNQTFAQFGWSVGSAGDVNADGYADVIVGAWTYDNTLVDEGRAYVYLGSPSGLGTNPAWTADGGQAGCGFGWWVGTAGDVNRDGYSDVMVGATRYTNGQQSEGRLFVYLGSATGLEATPAWTGESDQAEAELGRSLGTAGDVNGDGYSDVVAGAWEWDGGQSNEGWAALWLGNERLAADAHLTLLPRQRRVAGGPLDLFDRSDSPSSFRLEARGRSAAGRARVRLEWNVAEVPDAIVGPPSFGNWFATGVPIAGLGSAVNLLATPFGLASDSPHHWRGRIAAASPFFPHTPWLAPAPSVPSLMHFRTKVGALAVGEPEEPEESPPAGAWIEATHPNPFTPPVAIAYRVPQAGTVRLAIYDAAGRRVVTLVDGRLEAGRQVAIWDGLNQRGERAATGVYFARLEAGTVTHQRKLVLSR